MDERLEPGFVPVPAVCFDVLMPALTDSEWRILCVVLRQTLGWTDGQSGRKERDWITQSSFKSVRARAATP